MQAPASTSVLALDYFPRFLKPTVVLVILVFVWTILFFPALTFFYAVTRLTWGKILARGDFDYIVYRFGFYCYAIHRKGYSI